MQIVYERQSAWKIDTLEQPFQSVDKATNAEPAKMIWQCIHCFTVYDETCGDSENNIPPGTSFVDLPEEYYCPLCEAGKEDFSFKELIKQFQ